MFLHTVMFVFGSRSRHSLYHTDHKCTNILQYPETLADIYTETKVTGNANTFHSTKYSAHSMGRMEQYFPFRWANLSQVIRFQVSLENAKSSNGRLFYLYGLFALGLLDDSEISDVLGEGDNVTLIV